jgi:serine/threonine protein phosphatase PrpC
MWIVGRTDQGKVRSNNEDFFAIDDGAGLAVLADGMGGLNAGEVASERAVTCVVDAFRQALRTRPDLDVAGRAELLERAIHAANQAVFELGQSRFDYQGMGTTLVAAALQGRECALAYVGDSRIYRFDGATLAQVSIDHSVVQQLVEEGVLSPAEARRAPNRNIVTRAVGIEAEVRVDVLRQRLAPGELLLLCTDGLTDVVDDEQIRRHFTGHADHIGELADVLIETALQAGGTDNISVVIIAP